MRTSPNHTRRPQYPALPPMMILRMGSEMEERLAVEAFTNRWATADHYDLLADTINQLRVAGEMTKDVKTIEQSKLGQNALRSILARQRRVGKFGCTGDELTALRRTVVYNQAYWLDKSTVFYGSVVDWILGKG